MSDPSQNQNGRLVGWKRISNHLGCSERTARRWEREEDLPVHRQQHNTQSTVYAHIGELDDWLKSRSSGTAMKRDRAKPLLRRTLAAFMVIIALALVGVLGMRGLVPKNTQPIAGSADPLAVDLYERGRALWLQRGEEPNTRAIKLLEEAVERDAAYAEAWEALASAWRTLPTYSDAVDPQQAFNEALHAADQATRLNPKLVEARSVMASVAHGRGDWIGAERIYQDALSIDPNNTTLMLWFGEHYREVGYIEKNLKVLREALKLDPASPPLQTAMGMMTHIGPDPQAAQDDLLRIWTDTGFENPNAWYGIWHTHVRMGNYDAAEDWMAQSPLPINGALLKAFLEAKRGGSIEMIDQTASDIFAAYEGGFEGWFAYSLLDHLGQTDLALSVAEQEAATGQFFLSVVMFDPMFPEARFSPRFEPIVQRLGYIDYWKRFGPPDFCKGRPVPPVCVSLSTTE
ncbi:MAG: tetratricopeptide repeat protein [Henriciella sp.]|nr:tetratricopeptide repeat protein [Henriciella sp.]